MARPWGCRGISMDTIEKIIELSEKGASRPEIAKKLNISKDTVWRYQKKFEIL